MSSSHCGIRIQSLAEPHKPLWIRHQRGTLVVAAPVFAELIAAPSRTETFVKSFLEETGVTIDWDLGEPVWRSAGRAFQSYAERRRKQRDSGARRFLADFLIGAQPISVVIGS